VRTCVGSYEYLRRCLRAGRQVWIWSVEFKRWICGLGLGRKLEAPLKSEQVVSPPRTIGGADEDGRSSPRRFFSTAKSPLFIPSIFCPSPPTSVLIPSEAREKNDIRIDNANKQLPTSRAHARLPACNPRPNPPAQSSDVLPQVGEGKERPRLSLVRLRCLQTNNHHEVRRPLTTTNVHPHPHPHPHPHTTHTWPPLSVTRG